MDLSNKNVIHKNNNGIEYLQFRKLLEYKNISHAISLSPLDFGGINNYKEIKEQVNQNYKLLCNEIGIDPKDILRPIQTHTDVVCSVKDKKSGILCSEFKDVDGLITNVHNIALSLTYADCIPLCFYDPNKKVIANVHSGWKGTYSLICKNAINKMIEDYKSNPEDILCFIGPSICKKCFEVDEDIYMMFWNKFKNYDRANEIFSIGKIKDGKQKYHINTVLINRETMEKLGILKENIIESDICSCCNSNKIYSYRADKTLKRNTLIISIK